MTETAILTFGEKGLYSGFSHHFHSGLQNYLNFGVMVIQADARTEAAARPFLETLR